MESSNINDADVFPRFGSVKLRDYCDGLTLSSLIKEYIKVEKNWKKSLEKGEEYKAAIYELCIPVYQEYISSQCEIMYKDGEL